jgi:hypothetical protein
MELRARMADAVERYGVPGRYAVAVTDLQTGETVSVNGSRPQLSGCSINLFVLRQVLLDVQAGMYDISQVDELFTATTWSSNAATAKDLYGVVGGGDVVAGVRRVQSLMASLGLNDSLLDHPPLYVEFSAGQTTDNMLTAEDANRALYAFWWSELDGQWSSYFWRKLATVKPGLNYLLGIAGNATVSHKNGFFEAGDGFVDNDIGIAHWTSASGEVGYAFSFLSEGVRVKYSDIPLGQSLVQMANEYFRRLYGE